MIAKLTIFSLFSVAYGACAGFSGWIAAGGGTCDDCKNGSGTAPSADCTAAEFCSTPTVDGAGVCLAAALTATATSNGLTAETSTKLCVTTALPTSLEVGYTPAAHCVSGEFCSSASGTSGTFGTCHAEKRCAANDASAVDSLPCECFVGGANAYPAVSTTAPVVTCTVTQVCEATGATWGSCYDTCAGSKAAGVVAGGNCICRRGTVPASPAYAKGTHFATGTTGATAYCYADTDAQYGSVSATPKVACTSIDGTLVADSAACICVNGDGTVGDAFLAATNACSISQYCTAHTTNSFGTCAAASTTICATLDGTAEVTAGCICRNGNITAGTALNGSTSVCTGNTTYCLASTADSYGTCSSTATAGGGGGATSKSATISALLGVPLLILINMLLLK